MNDKYTPEEAMSLVRRAIFEALDNSPNKRILPDLVVVPRNVYDQFVQFKRPEAVAKAMRETFGEGASEYTTLVVPSEYVDEIECYERMKTKSGTA